MERADIELADIEYERSLQSLDIQQALHITKHEATEFLQTFGKEFSSRKRIISQREFAMLRLDGTAAKWVKANCGKGKRYDA